MNSSQPESPVTTVTSVRGRRQAGGRFLCHSARLVLPRFLSRLPDFIRRTTHIRTSPTGATASSWQTTWMTRGSLPSQQTATQQASPATYPRSGICSSPTLILCHSFRHRTSRRFACRPSGFTIGYDASMNSQRPETPNHALQRTAPRVTVAAISYSGVFTPSHLSP